MQPITNVKCSCGLRFPTLDDWARHTATEHYGVEIFPKKKSQELLKQQYEEIKVDSGIN